MHSSSVRTWLGFATSSVRLRRAAPDPDEDDLESSDSDEWETDSEDTDSGPISDKVLCCYCCTPRVIVMLLILFLSLGGWAAAVYFGIIKQNLNRRSRCTVAARAESAFTTTAHSRCARARARHRAQKAHLLLHLSARGAQGRRAGLLGLRPRRQRLRRARGHRVRRARLQGGTWRS